MKSVPFPELRSLGLQDFLSVALELVLQQRETAASGVLRLYWA
jgi:hypothetical protein